MNHQYIETVGDTSKFDNLTMYQIYEWGNC